MKVKKKGRKYVPSSFLVIIGLMLLFIIASWIGKATHLEGIKGIGFLDVFTSIWHGFKDRADVILFVFSIGGTLGVLTRLKVIDSGISALVKKLGKKVIILIPIMMIIFGLGGTTYGMWEETIAFIPVLIPVFKKSNYGSFTAIMVILIGAGVGCLASTINPFAVGAAVSAVQGVEGVKALGITSGTLQGTRWLSFVLFELVAIALVMWSASRYRKAIVANYATDKEAIAQGHKNKFIAFFTRARVVEGLNHKAIEERFKSSDDVKFTPRKKASLALFILSFVLMVLMYLPWSNWIHSTAGTDNYDKFLWWFGSTSTAGYAKLGDWYFVSIAAIFLLVAIIIFFINFQEFKVKPGEKVDEVNPSAENNFIKSYMQGAKDVLVVCLIIAVAGGLGRVLEATGFGNLIAKEAAKGLTNWIAFGVVIFLISIVLSLLVPSTSGFAGAFMPVFAGIAVHAFGKDATTAIGIAMLGFLFANGLANFVTPTSAALMGYTAYAGVPYNVWLKQVWKMVLVFTLLSLIIIVGFSAAAASGSSLF